MCNFSNTNLRFITERHILLNVDSVITVNNYLISYFIRLWIMFLCLHFSIFSVLWKLIFLNTEHTSLQSIFHLYFLVYSCLFLCKVILKPRSHTNLDSLCWISASMWLGLHHFSSTPSYLAFFRLFLSSLAFSSLRPFCLMFFRLFLSSPAFFKLLPPFPLFFRLALRSSIFSSLFQSSFTPGFLYLPWYQSWGLISFGVFFSSCIVSFRFCTVLKPVVPLT